MFGIRNLIFLTQIVSSLSTESEYRIIGCYKDKPSRAISGGYVQFDRNPIRNCFLKAKNRGNEIFAIQAYSYCFTSDSAVDTYFKYGPSGDCDGGYGGPWANDVYKVLPTGSFLLKKIDLLTKVIRGLKRLTDSNITAATKRLSGRISEVSDKAQGGIKKISNKIQEESMKLSAQILKEIEDLSKHTRNYTNQGMQTLHADINHRISEESDKAQGGLKKLSNKIQEESTNLSAQILKQITNLSKHTTNYTNQGLQTLHADINHINRTMGRYSDNIDKNKGIIEKNTGNIEKNKAGIEKNTGNIEKNKAGVEKNTGNIENNKAGIEKNTGNIWKNTGNIDNNIGNIENNAGNIENNTVNIEKNKGGIEKNTGNIEKNKAGIEKNTGNIERNKAGIEKNTGNIEKNKAGIEKNTGNIGKNTGNIDKNIGNIEKNAGNIENNTVNIEKNKGGIQENKGVTTSLNSYFYPIGTKDHVAKRYYPEFQATFIGFGIGSNYEAFGYMTLEKCIATCYGKRKEDTKYNGVSYHHTTTYCNCVVNSKGHNPRTDFLHYYFT